MVYTHSGGVEGIATDLYQMLSADLSARLDLERYNGIKEKRQETRQTIVAVSYTHLPVLPFASSSFISASVSVLPAIWRNTGRAQSGSRKISINTAAEAPNPVSRIAGERLSRIEQMCIRDSC